MNLFITAIAVLLLGGTAALLTGNNPRLATRLGAGGVFAGYRLMAQPSGQKLGIL